jgi:cation-transporting ATPase E
MVKALQSRGHTVAMTGDGVNDVLALKDSDCGIAMASGSAATRAVAQLVLLDSNFSGLPRAVGEGRRVINNIERVASLFLTKTTYALIIAVLTVAFREPFPFLPRHLTLVGSLTIGVPAFFLALAPNAARVGPGFLHRVLRFAVPAGLIAAAVTFAAYVDARHAHGTTPQEAQTAATLVLASVAIIVLARVARPIAAWKVGLVVVMAAFVGSAIVVGPVREYFELDMPSGSVVWFMAVMVVVAAVAMRPAAMVSERLVGRWFPDLARHPGEVEQPADVS